MMGVHTVIEDAIRIGIPIKIEYDIEKGFVYIVDEFYKSGHITIEEENDKLIAHARYNEKTEISSPYDIVMLNYEWWKRSKNKFSGWALPSETWQSLFDYYNITNNVASFKTCWQDISENFDWEMVQTIMLTLNWVWLESTNDQNHLPSINDIKAKAYNLVLNAYFDNHTCESCGLKAYWCDNALCLSFIPVDYKSLNYD